jgi:hypothetical protein
MMSVLDWTTHRVAYRKKYAELGKVCFEDVGRFEECDHVWAVVGIVLGIVCVLVISPRIFIANIRLISVCGCDGRQNWRSLPRRS